MPIHPSPPPATGHPRVAVIGAGSAGLATAAALQAAGLDYDVFEAHDDVGGNWYRGIYASAHTISSRKTTGYVGFPMPATYPHFPGRAQMLDYIRAYADHAGVRPRIRFGTSVARLLPRGAHARDGWRVVLADGGQQDYGAVVVANGHLWQPVTPDVAPGFTGEQLHARHYRDASSVRGHKVLVVGVGNTGCDIACELAQSGREVSVSARRGVWFTPKTFFGVPRAELPWSRLPDALQARLARFLSIASLGRPATLGLPEPRHAFLDEPPVVNSQLPYLLQHGLVQPRAGIRAIEGTTVHWHDARPPETFDSIVWATGYSVGLPFLDESLLEWAGPYRSPLRWAGGTVPTTLDHIYFNGLVSPRGGNLPLHSLAGEVIARAIAWQQRGPGALRPALARRGPAHARMRPSVPELRRELQEALRWLSQHPPDESTTQERP